MTEILIVTWDGGGNVPPALLIGTELRRRGHGVRMLGHAALAGAAGRSGIEFRSYPTAPDFSCVDDTSPARMLKLFSDKAIGRDTVDEARRVPTDVVLVDCLLIGALHACDATGLPYVSLEHFFDAYLRRGWLRGPMGLTARIRGLHPVRSWNRAVRALAVTNGELDPAGGGLHPPNLVFTGPAITPPAMPSPLADRPAAILISLSTFAYGGMTRAMQTLLDATADLSTRASS